MSRRRTWVSLFAAAVALAGAGVTAAGPPVQPPPAKEWKNGKWQVKVEHQDEGSKAYWFGAAMALVIGAGLGATVAGRFIGRGARGGLAGAGIGLVVGVAVVAVLGRPPGTPEAVGPAMVAVYAVFGAVAGWRAGRERAAEVPAVSPGSRSSAAEPPQAGPAGR